MQKTSKLTQEALVERLPGLLHVDVALGLGRFRASKALDAPYSCICKKGGKVFTPEFLQAWRWGHGRQMKPGEPQSTQESHGTQGKHNPVHKLQSKWANPDAQVHVQ